MKKRKQCLWRWWDFSSIPPARKGRAVLSYWVMTDRKTTMCKKNPQLITSLTFTNWLVATVRHWTCLTSLYNSQHVTPHWIKTEECSTSQRSETEHKTMSSDDLVECTRGIQSVCQSLSWYSQHSGGFGNNQAISENSTSDTKSDGLRISRQPLLRELHKV